MQGPTGEEVDVEPNWPPPVGGVMFSVVLVVHGSPLRQRPEAIWGVELVWVLQGGQNQGNLGRVDVKDAKNQWK